MYLPGVDSTALRRVTFVCISMRSNDMVWVYCIAIYGCYAALPGIALGCIQRRLDNNQYVVSAWYMDRVPTSTRVIPH
jgi:hypothetical protein